MAFAIARSDARPLSEINTTPLIDVMLVLLVMLVVTIPVATHSIDVEIPQIAAPMQPDPVSNRLRLSEDGVLTWNDTAINDAQLAALLAETKAMPIVPELQFEPAATAAYARSAEILRIIKQSKISGFGFVGNERYANFGEVE